MAATFLCFVAIWISAEIFLKDKSMIGSFVQVPSGAAWPFSELLSFRISMEMPDWLP